MTRLTLVPVLLGAGCSAPAAPELVVTEFTFPWADRPAPRTEFRARTDAGRLHFAFAVDDPEVIVADTWNGEGTVDGEDRVELFFAKDAGLADYWCIEIDPRGRVHDYHARHYRQFDSSWNCPGLEAEGRLTPAGYEVRGSIPLATLGELLGRPVGRGSEVRVGLFRAEFYGAGPATRGEVADNWVSWVRPPTPRPDFHVPEAFRTMTLP